MEKKIRFLFTGIILCCLVFIVPVAALNEGKIAFISNLDDNADIYVMNADGSWQTPPHQRSSV